MEEPIPKSIYVEQMIAGLETAPPLARPLQPPTRNVNSTDMDRDQINDMIGVSEARADTKLAVAMGEVREEFAGLRGDIRELKAASVSKTTFALGGLALFAALVATLAYASQWFGLGLQSHDVLMQAAREGAAQALAAAPKH